MVTPFIFSAGRQVYAIFLLVVGKHHRQPRFDEEVAVRFPYQVRFRPGTSRMAFLYHCYPVLPVFFRKGKGRLAARAYPVSPHLFQPSGVRFLAGNDERQRHRHRRQQQD